MIAICDLSAEGFLLRQNGKAMRYILSCPLQTMQLASYESKKRSLGKQAPDGAFHGFQRSHQDPFPDRDRPLGTMFLTAETADAVGIIETRFAADDLQ